jgi:hypothetical protein
MGLGTVCKRAKIEQINRVNKIELADFMKLMRSPFIFAPKLNQLNQDTFLVVYIENSLTHGNNDYR